MDYGINSIINFCINTSSAAQTFINNITMFDIYTAGVTIFLAVQLVPKCKDIINRRQVYKNQIIDYVTNSRISNTEIEVSNLRNNIENIRKTAITGSGASSLGYSNYECDTSDVNLLPMFQSYCPQPLQPPQPARSYKTPLQPPLYATQPPQKKRPYKNPLQPRYVPHPDIIPMIEFCDVYKCPEESSFDNKKYV